MVAKHGALVQARTTEIRGVLKINADGQPMGLDRGESQSDSIIAETRFASSDSQRKSWAEERR
jgi:hypothetical protein